MNSVVFELALLPNDPNDKRKGYHLHPILSRELVED